MPRRFSRPRTGTRARLLLLLYGNGYVDEKPRTVDRREISPSIQSLRCPIPDGLSFLLISCSSRAEYISVLFLFRFTKVLRSMVCRLKVLLPGIIIYAIRVCTQITNGTRLEVRSSAPRNGKEHEDRKSGPTDIIVYFVTIIRVQGTIGKNEQRSRRGYGGRDGCGRGNRVHVGLWASGERVVQLTKWGKSSDGRTRCSLDGEGRANNFPRLEMALASRALCPPIVPGCNIFPPEILSTLGAVDSLRRK